MRPLLISLGLSGCWTGSTQPTLPSSHAPDPVSAVIDPAVPEPVVEQPEAPTPSYRATTMTIDSVGIAAMAAGLALVARNERSDAGHGLALSGMTLAAFGSPIAHLVHGRKGRAVGSYLIRSLSATTGVMIGIGVRSCPEAGAFTQLDCALEGMVWGMAGGLVLGSALDALFLHDRPGREQRNWIPTVTPNEGGARVGILGAF